MGGRWTAEQQRAARARLRAKGICVQCGQRPKDPASTSQCADCIVKCRKIARQIYKCGPHAKSGIGRRPIVRPDQ